jgi:hypothetical protein
MFWIGGEHLKRSVLEQRKKLGSNDSCIAESLLLQTINLRHKALASLMQIGSPLRQLTQKKVTSTLIKVWLCRLWSQTHSSCHNQAAPN